MSDELNSQLSAFIDDELTPEESELFVRRLCRDETLRQTASNYSVVGSVMRGEKNLALNAFAASVMMAVEGQSVPEVAAPVTVDRSKRQWGYALAASVALAAIALMTLPDSGPDAVEPMTAMSDVATTFASGDNPVTVARPVNSQQVKQDPAAANQPLVAASNASKAIDPAPTRPVAAAVIDSPQVAATVPGTRSAPSRQTTTFSQPPVLTSASISNDGPAQTAPSIVNSNRSAVSKAASIRAFTITPASQNSANGSGVVPVNAENRARLNNLLLQHLNSSGASRQRGGVAFRNVGFETQTESPR